MPLVHQNKDVWAIAAHTRLADRSFEFIDDRRDGTRCFDPLSMATRSLPVLACSGSIPQCIKVRLICSSRACSHYSQCFDDECKAEKRQEDDVQFFKT
jgi:hypothetical protein